MSHNFVIHLVKIVQDSATSNLQYSSGQVQKSTYITLVVALRIETLLWSEQRRDAVSEVVLCRILLAFIPIDH